MSQELLRIIDGIARDKNIDAETVFEDLEAAMLSAIRKANPTVEDVDVHMDRQTGEITAIVAGKPMAIDKLGRIAAQTAKQVMIQRIREAERDSIYEEYLQRKGEIVTGKTVRWEGGSLIVDLGRTEAYLPRSEQIPGESHGTDERIRAMVLDVREDPGTVRIILSRTHPDFIRAMFELEVPEVAEKIIEIKVLAREAGYRTKAAVNSLDSKVDAVGACVGIRGSRIKSIVEELGGEKVDIVRWNDSSKILIGNSLKPAEVAEIALCFELGRATVVVTDDQLSLAIGKRGQNVRLAARLTNWDIDILTPTEFNAGLDNLEKALREVEGVDSTIVDQIIAMGMVNVLDVEEVGREPLIKELQMSAELAAKIGEHCAEAARRIAEEQAQARADAEEQAKAKADAEKQAKADASAAASAAAAAAETSAEKPTAAEAESPEPAAASETSEEPTAQAEAEEGIASDEAPGEQGDTDDKTPTADQTEQPTEQDQTEDTESADAPADDEQADSPDQGEAEAEEAIASNEAPGEQGDTDDKTPTADQTEQPTEQDQTEDTESPDAPAADEQADSPDQAQGQSPQERNGEQT